MTIRKIKVENVKGAKCIEIIDQIIPNKPSLLVAPNGFGKTSITTAFASLNAKRIKLDDEHIHQANAANKPKLTIALEDGNGMSNELIADEASNSISPHLDIHVINSKLRPKAIKRNMGGFTTATARLALDEIVLIPKIPKKQSFSYSITGARQDFGVNGKCLPNIQDDLDNGALASALLANQDVMSKFSGARVTSAVSHIKGKINAALGTTPELLQWIETNVASDLDDIACIKAVADLICASRPISRTRTNLLLAALQVCESYIRDPSRFKAACEHVEYLADRDSYNQLITSFDTTWKSVRATEKSGQLVVDFPNPSMVSNGQRDSLSFAAQIQRVRRRIAKRDIVLIVDEIFDYLDDANLVAAQYYISNLIQEAKTRGIRIYTLIFTHLNPLFFKNYAFRDQKVYYLDKRKPSINQNFRRLIVKREDPQIKAGVDHHFLHFAPSPCDLATAFKALGMPESWGDSETFAKHTESEWKKYASRSDDYDPFAVCCYVRVSIEKKIFDLILEPAKADQFIKTNGTKKKLEYAASIGIEVPDVCFLLGIIYNEGLHIKEHVDNSSPIVSKLENIVIRRMLGEAVKS